MAWVRNRRMLRVCARFEGGIRRPIPIQPAAHLQLSPVPGLLDFMPMGERCRGRILVRFLEGCARFEGGLHSLLLSMAGKVGGRLCFGSAAMLRVTTGSRVC